MILMVNMFLVCQDFVCHYLKILIPFITIFYPIKIEEYFNKLNMKCAQIIKNLI